MKRAIIQYSSDAQYGEMLAITNAVHWSYCAKHSIDLIIDHGQPNRLPIWWRKVELLREHLPRYDQVMWLDADCVIVADNFNVFDASGYGIAVCECWDSPTVVRHLQCGVVICSNTPEVREFLDVWHDYPMVGVPRPHWGDQAAFIQLMAKQPYRDLLTILPNRFNHEVLHMEARKPVFIEAFHGLKNRAALMRECIAAYGAR